MYARLARHSWTSSWITSTYVPQCLACAFPRADLHADDFLPLPSALQYRTIRALSLPQQGQPEYLSVPARQLRHGIARPELPAGYLRRQASITVNRELFTFYVYYCPLPASQTNLNMSVLTALRGRVFYGELLVFRASPRAPSRLVNLRAGHRAFALSAAEV